MDPDPRLARLPTATVAGHRVAVAVTNLSRLLKLTGARREAPIAETLF